MDEHQLLVYVRQAHHNLVIKAFEAELRDTGAGVCAGGNAVSLAGSAKEG